MPIHPHRSVSRQPAVAEVQTPAQKFDDCMSMAARAQTDLLARRQAQIHSPRPRVLKPPLG